MRTRTAVVLAVFAGMSFSAQAQDCASHVESQKSQCSAEQSALLSRLPGQWSGNIQVRQDKSMSGSIASLCAQREKDGSIVLVFDGFAQGKEVRGAAKIEMKDGSPQSLRITESITGRSRQSDARSSESAKFVFVSEKEHLKHTIRIDKERLVLERFSLGEKGEETLVMALTLDRLPKDQQASAQELMSDSSLLAKVDASSSVMQANVNE